MLDKLDNAGLRLNRGKYYFLKSSVEFIGHIIDGQGLHPTTKEVTVTQDVPKPKNVTELRSFLGLINNYSHFLPNLSSKLVP